MSARRDQSAFSGSGSPRSRAATACCVRSKSGTEVWVGRFGHEILLKVRRHIDVGGLGVTDPGQFLSAPGTAPQGSGEDLTGAAAEQ